MTPEKELITAIGHYLNFRITEENEKYLTKLIEKYYDSKPPKLQKVIIHDRRDPKRSAR